MKSSAYEEKQNLYKKAREEIDQLIRMGDKNTLVKFNINY